MQHHQLKDFRLPGASGDRGACNGVFVLSVVCPVCGEQVTESCMAFGEPYWCLIHRTCAPHFPFDGEYPHRRAIVHLNK